MIRPIHPEPTTATIRWTRGGQIAKGGSYHLAMHHTPQAEATHQAFKGTTGELNVLTLQFPPYPVGTIHLKIGLPEALNMQYPKFVPPNPCTE